MLNVMKVAELQKALSSLEDSNAASLQKRFFKTGPGEYGEGDLFRGIRVPVLRKLAKEYQSLTLAETEGLLRSSYHEDRLLALLILVRAYLGGDDAVKERAFDSISKTLSSSIIGIWLTAQPRKSSAHSCGTKIVMCFTAWLGRATCGSGGSQSSLRFISSGVASSVRR